MATADASSSNATPSEKEVQSGWRVTLSTAMSNSLNKVLSEESASQISERISDFSKRLEIFNRFLVQLEIIANGRDTDAAKADREEKVLLEDNLIHAKDVIGSSELKTRVVGSDPSKERQHVERATFTNYIFTSVLEMQAIINATTMDVASSFSDLGAARLNLLKVAQDTEKGALSSREQETSDRLRSRDMQEVEVNCTPEGINKVRLALSDLQTKLSRVDESYGRAVSAYKALNEEMERITTSSAPVNLPRMQDEYRKAFLEFYKEIAYFINPTTMREAVDIADDLFVIEVFVTDLNKEYERVVAPQQN